MALVEYLKTAGEHVLTLQGASGSLEAVLTVPCNVQPGIVAFLGHPHPLQGGTMNNKVMTTLASAFKQLNIPSLRFNFRGVGLSAGVFDQGIGESEDMLTLIKQWQERLPDLKIILAGFSFGSYVAYRAAIQLKPLVLISIAPPVERYYYTAAPLLPHPWLIIQGDADEVVSYASVVQFVQQNPSLDLIEFAETSHFFHGKLIQLKDKLITYLQKQVGL